MEKLKMHSINKVDVNIKKIAELFPNTLTEVIKEYREDGSPIIEYAIDFDMLKQELSDVLVEGSDERYQFTWPDKKMSVLLANAPIAKTLRPYREESVDFDNTENLYIEGDNLDVLKLLQETYLGKVKMIYIDPPYNTGNDYIYQDDFSQNKSDYLGSSGQFDEYGNRLVQNTESNGRFHTDWLNMIYPRLKLGKDLLTDDGVIFISIDDSEIENLRKVCNEIFGHHNFVAELVWQSKKGGGNDSNYIAVEHEYIVVYARNKNSLKDFYEMYSEEYLKRYKDEDEISKFYWDTFKRKSGKQYYPITCPDGTVLQYDDDGNQISWLRSEKRFLSDLEIGDIRFVKTDKSWSVQFKQRLPKGKKPRSIFTTETVIDDKGTTSEGSDDVYNLFKKDVFSNPKPVSLIKFLIGFGLQSGEYILDFFSGSGTIAQAVMECNLEDNGNRHFIAVQIQEDLDKMLEKTPANKKLIIENAISVLDSLDKKHYITELAKERIMRAGKNIKEGSEDRVQDLDLGFRVLKLDSTNMQDVYYTPSEFRQGDLFTLEENIKPDRTPEDLLFQVMLDLGVLLSSQIEETSIKDKKVFDVANGYLLACFDTDITSEVISEIAKKQPYYAAFRDSSMANDSVATNFEQIFETYSPTTIRKVL
ncbi:site-specific DNA-methyltransferase [Neobacillus niacini]|uniref:site-specific DNA-methyltransferase n=1 Tax=Neobacillus niacini TaxID=86668 RepID=UPI0021CB475A|nr:site-specific DNA-methyltransferase [Neobacillus niacini]MCM3768138.1 site-specific DNA-methyltransferase [Neobacillus niacini]